MHRTTRLPLVTLAMSFTFSCCSGSNSSPAPTPPGGPVTLYSEDFEGIANGSPWPSPWVVPTEASTPMLNADIQNGRGRLRGQASGVARIVQQGLNIQDLDVYYTIEYEAYASQGIGFYGRQNGGRLVQTTPPGTGYGIFIQGSSNNMSHWYEAAGNEIEYPASSMPPTVTVTDGVRYRVRFQVEQIDATTTTLRAKMWLEGDPEPGTWRVTYTSSASDSAAEANLQSLADGLAIDVYNYNGTASIYIDDIVVYEL